MKVYYSENEFNINTLRENIMQTVLNIYSQGRHTPTIEISIKSIKQVERCTKHYVPYKSYTRLMIRPLVE